MTPMIVEHPLLQHKLSILRNKQTGTKEFRDLVGEIATLLCYEVHFRGIRNLRIPRILRMHGKYWKKATTD